MCTTSKSNLIELQLIVARFRRIGDIHCNAEFTYTCKFQSEMNKIPINFGCYLSTAARSSHISNLKAFGECNLTKAIVTDTVNIVISDLIYQICCFASLCCYCGIGNGYNII